MIIPDPRAKMQVREMTESDIEAVSSLWALCGLTRPWNNPHDDIAFALAGATSAGLVGVFDGVIVASVLVGHDGHRGSVYYVSVHPDHRGRGLGEQIMDGAEDWLRSRGVWKLNLLVRRENDDVLSFYKALGFTDQECVSLGKRLDGRPDRFVPGEDPDTQE